MGDIIDLDPEGWEYTWLRIRKNGDVVLYQTACDHTESGSVILSPEMVERLLVAIREDETTSQQSL